MTRGSDAEGAAYLQRVLACQVEPELDLLTSCVSPDCLTTVWTELIPDDWVDWIGGVVICAFGPDAETDIAIVCLMVSKTGRRQLTIQSDPGRIKYDPALEKPLAKLCILSELVVEVIETTLLDHQADMPLPGSSRRQFLLAMLKEVKTRMVRTGLDARVKEARNELRSLQHWLGVHRTSADTPPMVSHP